jgi:DUF1365 family protein
VRRRRASGARTILSFLELASLLKLASFLAPAIISGQSNPATARAMHRCRWTNPSAASSPRTGKRPTGPIRLLTHLRYFGHSFNPVSFYYCFDSAGTNVETIVAEITNTPWKERHAYVLPVAGSAVSGGAWRFQFDKQFHVSPFMPMDMRYDWRFSAPAAGLHVHMENWRDGRSAFDATLSLKREPITSASLARALAAFPLMTAQVITLIHWQALRLWLKRTPFFTHPDKLPTVRGTLPP